MPQAQEVVDPNAFASTPQNESSLFDLYQPAPPSQGHTQAVMEEFAPQEIPQQAPMWTVPGGIIEQEEAGTASTPPHGEAHQAPRKVGFWSWVAGADLAS